MSHETEVKREDGVLERVFLRACHPASPNHNCTWTVSKDREGSVEYVRAASARKEEREAIKSMLEDYFKHFFCTCHGSTRTGGHFASCPITIRDEVLGRLQGLEASASKKGEMNG